MAQIYILDYSFLFGDDSPFSHLWEFEKLFAEFLSQRGLEAVLVKAVEGSPAKRLMIIRKKQGVTPQSQMETKQRAPAGRPILLKTRIKQLSDRKLRKPAIQFMKGKK